MRHFEEGALGRQILIEEIDVRPETQALELFDE